MKYKIKQKGKEDIIIEGELLQRDKTNPRLSSYCHYFMVEGKIKVYSAFHYEYEVYK